MKKILIIEDENNIRNLLNDFFTDKGFLVKTAENGEIGLEIFEDFSPHLIILDIMMPAVDGWTVAKKIRKTCETPIIMLTAKNQEHDELYGFNLGINDYVKKPFSLEILLARVNKNFIYTNNTVQIGKLTIDNKKNSVKVNEKYILLSKTEYNILQVFIENSNKVLSRDFLIRKIWGYEYDGDDRTVDTHITRLRNKLGQDFKNIKTIRGFGYLLEVENEIN